MRQERTVQSTLFDIFAEHEIGRELKAISQWLDEHRDLLGLVVADLHRHGLKDTGRHEHPSSRRSYFSRLPRQISVICELFGHLDPLIPIPPQIGVPYMTQQRGELPFIGDGYLPVSLETWSSPYVARPGP